MHETPLRRTLHTYCINPDGRTEHWASMTMQFTKLRLPAERFSVAQPHVPLEYYVQIAGDRRSSRGRWAHSQLAPGSAVSHVHVWQDIVQRCGDANDVFLIVEDSCKFLQDFSEERLSARLLELSHPWDVVHLGGHYVEREENIQSAQSVCRSAAYVITPGGARSYLELASNLRDEKEIEKYHKLLQSYSLLPPLVVWCQYLTRRHSQTERSHQQSIISSPVSYAPTNDVVVDGLTMDKPVVSTVSGDPLILTIDGLCSPARVEQMKWLLEQQSMEDLRKTDNYVDDVFEAGKEEAEDSHFKKCLAQSSASIPAEYNSDPLRSFLWLAGHHTDDLTAEDLRHGTAAFERRASQSRWELNAIARGYLEESRFRKSATRWKVPECMMRCMAPLFVKIFGTGAKGVAGSEQLYSANANEVSWELQDSTVVRYREGESQVPHVDTADATMILYLNDTGGSTTFPCINRKIAPSAGRILVFFTTRPEARSLKGGNPNLNTLHYGGMMEQGKHGEKLIVQLMVNAVDMGSTKTWQETLCGSIFKRGAACHQYFQHQEDLETYDDYDSDDYHEHKPMQLALCDQKCSANCYYSKIGDAYALDFVMHPGDGKYCINCWHSWLADLSRRY